MDRFGRRELLVGCAAGAGLLGLLSWLRKPSAGARASESYPSYVSDRRYWFYPPDRSRELNLLFGGPEGLEVVRRPIRVEATLRGRPADDLDRRPERYADWPRRAGPVVLPPAETSRLAEVLSTATTYDWCPPQTKCRPDWGAGLTFVGASRQVEVLICLLCRDLRVVEGERMMESVRFHDAQPLLLGLFRQAFPGDQALEIG